MFGSTRIANCGAWAALANSFSVWPTVIGSGFTRWKVSPGSSSSGRWAMWSIARATKSTGTMFVCPPSRAGEREPLRQRVAQPLEQLEEVVGTVDLVHLAGLRVADHDAGPEHERLGLDALAHEPLRLVLRAVVGVRAASAPRRTCPPGRRPCSCPATAIELVWWKRPTSCAFANSITCCVPSTFARSDGLLVGFDVVDGREVEEVVDRLVEALDAEAGLREVAGHRHDPSLGGAEPLRRARRACRASPRARARRWCPRASAARPTRCLPMKPVAPVTK